MRNFSDEFLKQIIDQRGEEFEPNDTLQSEWEFISKKLPRKRYVNTRYLFAALTLVAILGTYIPMVLVNQQPLAVKSPSSAPPEDSKPINAWANKKNDYDSHDIVVNKNQSTKGRYPESSQNLISEYSNSGQALNKLPVVHKEKSIHFNINPVFKDLVGQLKLPIETKMDSKRTVLQSLEEEIPASKISHWSLFAVVFYNTNRFVPVKDDSKYVQSFDQANGIFSNRIGLKFNFVSPSFKTKIGPVQTVISYGFLHKNYSFRYEELTLEDKFKQGSHLVNTLNHLFSAGFNAQLKPNFSIGIEYEFINNVRGNSPFANHYMLFNLSPTVYQKENVLINGLIEYGAPLTGQAFFKAQQINFGVRIRILKFIHS